MRSDYGHVVYSPCLVDAHCSRRCTARWTTPWPTWLYHADCPTPPDETSTALPWAHEPVRLDLNDMLRSSKHYPLHLLKGDSKWSSYGIVSACLTLLRGNPWRVTQPVNAGTYFCSSDFSIPAMRI